MVRTAMYRADGPEEMRPVGEVEFVQGLAAASGLYGPGRAAAAIVGHADLNLGARVEPVLEALRAASPSRFRGIRHSVTWDPHPEVENTAAHNRQGQLASDAFRAGARVLARMGLSLESAGGGDDDLGSVGFLAKPMTADMHHRIASVTWWTPALDRRA
jgi:hypothetical protein